MAELADVLDLGSNAARRAGSSPVTRTNANGDTVFERCCITIRFFIATSKW